MSPRGRGGLSTNNASSRCCCSMSDETGEAALSVALIPSLQIAEAVDAGIFAFIMYWNCGNWTGSALLTILEQ